MKTEHHLLFCDARFISASLKPESVDLVVTSPPYPMIAMWDEQFSAMNPDIREKLKREDAKEAFSLMHDELFKVWKEVYTLLKPGGFACINIGDATRKTGEDFQLFSNHSRITEQMVQLGFQALPLILWRKATNSPTKFMGSGVLPSGAYVTLEHEYILIFRKGGKRAIITLQEKKKRQNSAMFWEERNSWYSDVWDLPGVRQTISSGEYKARKRNASFPLELPLRLINMYSLQDDIVLDPFAGLGTTMRSAILSKRNSINVEWEKELLEKPLLSLPSEKKTLNQFIKKRIDNHLLYVESHQQAKGLMKYKHSAYGFPVKSQQEREIKFYHIDHIRMQAEKKSFIVKYSDYQEKRINHSSSTTLFQEILSQNNI